MVFTHRNDAQFLVDARWLREHRGDRSVILIDTRPAAEYWAGHLAGARHFDPFPFHYYDTSEKGLREFRAQLEWIFSALGVTSAATVVFYEKDSGMRAARGAWALEYMGHRAVRILDGGLKIASQELVTSAEPFAPSDFRAEPRDRSDRFVRLHPETYRPPRRIESLTFAATPNTTVKTFAPGSAERSPGRFISNGPTHSIPTGHSSRPPSCARLSSNLGCGPTPR